MTAYLVCSSLRWLCAFPAHQVAETMRPLPVERLADAPPFLSGIAVIRGIPLPVVNLGLLLSGDTGTPKRFVVVRIDERRSIALAVDEVVGVRELSPSLFGTLPPLLAQIERSGVAQVAALDTELLLLLETTRIVPRSVWSEIGERTA